MRFDEIAGDERIGRGTNHFNVRIGIENLGEQFSHERGIVNNQNATFRHGMIL
jgi:hypothetical protein